MSKQPIKKKTADDFKSSTLSDKLEILKKFKENNKIDNVKKKPQEWLVLPKAFEDATGVVGIPLNTVSCVKGHTNTGKSSLMLETIKACQKQGIVPIIFDLENALKWNHAKEVGVNVTETVDEETGEIILGPGEDMIYFDTVKLYEKYGTYDHSQSKYKDKPTRPTVVIEDVALCIRELINQQRLDELPFDMMFIIDSIGCSDCYKAALSSSSNAMWYAAAVSQCFMVIVNDLIPSTANVTSKYNNSMFFVNKIWVSYTAQGLSVAKEKGGNSLQYSTRFSIFLGGQAGSSIKKLSFTYQNVDYTYATTVKIKIDKNHITNIEKNGEIALTKDGICSISDLEQYKTAYKKFLASELKSKTGKEVSEKDLKESEEVVDD